jgi:hypothetical protein
MLRSGTLGWRDQLGTPPGLLVARASDGSLQQNLVGNVKVSLSDKLA